MNDRLFLILVVISINIMPILIDWVKNGGEQWYRPHVMMLLFTLIIVVIYWQRERK